MSHYYNYDSQAIIGLCRHELEDQGRWSVSSTIVDEHKIITITWHVSTLVYNYLMRKFDEALARDNIGGNIFRLYKNHGKGGGYHQRISTNFDINNDIHIIWMPYNRYQLTHSDVNMSTNELTAQSITLVLRLPYSEGLSTHTKGSKRWHRRGYDHNTLLDGRIYPYWQTFKLKCYVSSHRGLYARSSAGEITPLQCVIGKKYPTYKHYQVGLKTFQLKDTTESQSDKVQFYEGRTWEEFIHRNKYFGFSINSSVVYYQNCRLYGADGEVLSSDYIHSGYIYYYGSE